MNPQGTASAKKAWRRSALICLAVLALFPPAPRLCGAPHHVACAQSAQRIPAYDFVEVTLNVSQPDAPNPFTDVTVTGELTRKGGSTLKVDGFCDATDGSVFRLRFMPTQPGEYRYSVTYRQGAYESAHTGNFTAEDGHRKGRVRVDPKQPWHFLWEGTGEHYFYNGTTTYWLAGWDEGQIRQNLDRLARLQVNRVRAAISGRVDNGRAWFEHVYSTDRFSFLLNPWVARRPESVEDPGFDVTRFNVAYWRKWDGLLRHARELNLVVSVIFYVDGRRPGVDPFGKAGMGGPDEQRYYRYAAARFGAFANVMWDVSNEYRLFRDDAWAGKMGTFLKTCDPYHHLTSVHGHGDFRFRTAPWADFAMYQSWDEHGGYEFMLKNRQQQAATGRIMPQVNEEYGYEDHYPTWGGNRKAPARSADNRRRLAWTIYMAGGYQTTGERADTGTGWGPDTGGGWINGRGDAAMTMLTGYGRIVDFFTAIPWWELHPDNDFFTVPAQTSVQPELTHVVYTRNRAGQATFYVQGQKLASTTVAGDCSAWDSDYRLALANELTGDRPWLGELHQVAIYDRALDQSQVTRLYNAGARTELMSPLVLYDFRRDQGDTVQDRSGAGQPLNLKIANPAAVQWLSGGGLAVQAPVLIAATAPATKLNSAIRQSQEISLAVWIKPANTAQKGPARIVTLSKDPGQRNFTLGQKGGAYELRFRTTSTSGNGEPALSTPGGEDAPERICGLRNGTGDRAVIYLPAGGSVVLKAGLLTPHPKPRWYNPRTGQWMAATTTADNRFAAPDKKDWVLLFQSKP